MLSKRWAILLSALLMLALALPAAAQDGTEEATEPPVVQPPGEVTEQPTAEVTQPPAEETTQPATEVPGEATEQPTAEATAPAGPPPFEMPPLPAGAEVVAQGLMYPRQFEIGPDGTIYVAEVGNGGELMMQTPEGEVSFGMSSDVLAIAPDGTQTVVVRFLPSAAGTLGASDVALADDGFWVIVNGPGPETLPPFLTGSALRFNATDYHLIDYVNLYEYEAANDPDGNGVIDSNPTDIEIGPDGTVYMLDTGANTVYTWTADGGLTPFVTWPDNPVPTGLAFDADGNLWVSFLGAELAPGAGKVEQISPAGEVLATFSGYNALTDIAVADDGTVYAVSLFAGFGAQGPNPGQILRVSGDGGEIVVDGLMAPYGIAIDDGGNLLVSTGTAFVPPASGMILRFAPPM